ncbi:MAG TPA: F0F1 ATP synthase subunit delta, partial [Allosphingosinicella sp.]|nr:F0F1 ATP synthase subunit delta [Allosphingosinicella sp.]
MENSGAIQASLAGRYATALFGLARDQKQLETVGASLAALRQALAESEDLRQLTASPLITRDEAVRAAAAVAQSLRLDQLTANLLGVLARNHRLAQLGNVIRA